MESTLSDARVATYEYDDRTVLTVDFGAELSPSIDVVGDTAIVAFADGRQREFDLPDGEVQAVNNNGVVTFEVRR